MKRFLRRGALWLACFAAVLVILLILFYAEEDWRGANDWAACQREIAAKGESFELRQIAPPGKPEDDLSKVPIFAPLYQKEYDPKASINQIAIDLHVPDVNSQPKGYDYRAGKPFDLAAWQKFYRSEPEAHLPDKTGTPAQDILQVLSRFDSQANDIEAVLNNPNAYWPIDKDESLETSVANVRKVALLARFFQFRAIAHLENSETDLSENDYMLSFRLEQPFASGCLEDAYFRMIGIRYIDDAILWEGLRRHAWSDAQLRQMELALASNDVFAIGLKTLRAERAYILQHTKMLQGNYSALDEVQGKDPLLIGILALRPSGWWDQDRRHISIDMQKMIDNIDLSHGTLHPQAFNFQDDILRRSFWAVFYLPLTKITLGSVDDLGPKIAEAETYRRLARLACRLEEYRIAHGQYPDTLNELPDLPARLNQEVVSEEPLRYQHKGDEYLFYSVGWNQKDDGGVYSSFGNTSDWVWPSP